MNFRKADVRPATCCRRLVGRAELLLPARCRQHATVHGEASTATAHWDHEPRRIPFTRPSGTLSPSGGEGWGEGVRFMESLNQDWTRIGTMNRLHEVGRATPCAPFFAA